VRRRLRGGAAPGRTPRSRPPATVRRPPCVTTTSSASGSPAASWSRCPGCP